MKVKRLVIFFILFFSLFIASSHSDNRSVDNVIRLKDNMLPSMDQEQPELEEDVEVVELPEDKKPVYKPVYVGKDYDEEISPEEREQVRINPNAPRPFRNLVQAYQQGDTEKASAYAGQYVRYLVDLMFQVRQISQIIGEALIKEKLTTEEEFAGVEQLSEWQFAKSRKDSLSIFKPTHEHSLRQIKPDPKSEAEFYFIFALNCEFCREMSPDVQRVWEVVQKDKRVKMSALVMGNPEKSWVDSYSTYAGFTLPIQNGDEIAKALRIKMLPAVVVISPNRKMSYVRTGQQTFQHMLEFLRTVQNLPTELSPELQRQLARPIGEKERLSRKDALSIETRDGKVITKDDALSESESSMEVF